MGRTLANKQLTVKDSCHLRDKQNLKARLKRKRFEDPLNAMFKDSNIQYQIAERTRTIGCGGIGLFDDAMSCQGKTRGLHLRCFPL